MVMLLLPEQMPPARPTNTVSSFPGAEGAGGGPRRMYMRIRASMRMPTATDSCVTNSIASLGVIGPNMARESSEKAAK